jgi:putative iron-dependent peroxidase
MDPVQPGITAPVPRLARYLFFSLAPDADMATGLAGLRSMVDGEATVAGLGVSVISALGKKVDGLRQFPPHSGPGFDVPSTPCALWCWLRGDDRGELVHRTRRILDSVSPAFEIQDITDSFQYGASLDLTGYEDGTENPVGEEALLAAVVRGSQAGLNGGSFVAVQQWLHDLDRFEAMSQETRDHTIGRRQTDNEELDDAPESAHVKRTAQETFEPEAFILRRSMPWADGEGEGLVFVAFGRSFDAFEAQLSRMVGAEDGIADALFTFTRPMTGSYFWCPPLLDGRLDLRILGV